MPSRYTLKKFTKEGIWPITLKPKYVALIEDAEHPLDLFRVVVENADSVEQAKKDVAEWISLREQEDEKRGEEQAREAEEKQADDFLEELNSNV